MANNKMKKTAAKLAAAVLTAALAVQAVMPVIEVQAATSTANKMLEIPVSFQTDRVYTDGLELWSSEVYSKACSSVNGRQGMETPLVFTCDAADYTWASRVEYKVYIPADYFINEDSLLICQFFELGTSTETGISLLETNSSYVAASPSGVRSCGTPDDDTKFEAQMELEGNYYVLSVNQRVTSGYSYYYTDSEAESGSVQITIQPGFFGFSMDVEDGNIYLDDIKYSSASGKEIYSCDFEDVEETISCDLITFDGSGNMTRTSEISVKSVDTSAAIADSTATTEDTTGTTAEPSISATTATIAAGYTTKLSVTDGTVSSWKSSKKSVATVDKNGKVTGVKAGKATITATLDDGTKLSCKVTVKANKYTETKLTTSDVKSGKSDMQVYSAYYDDSGNLKIKVNVVNNTSSDFVKMENVKIVLKNSAGKTIGTYTKSSKTVSIKSGSTKTMTFTIKKSALKKTSANMTKAEVTTCKATFK